ncbi:MAG: hypothetical protein M3Y76_01715 [Chloroflexota bacterium]|nr:hypothetical protein [Chloroflexota bacterium]
MPVFLVRGEKGVSGRVQLRKYSLLKSLVEQVGFELIFEPAALHVF